MLMIMTERVLQHPSMSEIYKQLETDRNMVQKIMHALERAGFFSFLGMTSNLQISCHVLTRYTSTIRL